MTYNPNEDIKMDSHVALWMHPCLEIITIDKIVKPMSLFLFKFMVP